MYLSQLFIPITKDLPAEAKIKSHQLMLRTGMIKQSSAGIYSWLPLGFKVMKKIEQIVREEQNAIDAQEMLMPTIQSSEIWKESGRYDDYGEEMLRIKDRQGREMLYGPTNEELITDVFRSSIKSYKSLPQILYHIQWKFRDEIRPRFGVMRCKEFYMKDAYSFDLNEDEAKKRKLSPLAKIVSWSTCGVDPSLMGSGPIPASKEALKKAGWKIDDLDLIESNEAFAAQALAVGKDLGWDEEKLNVNGGAIAIGHPVGASGARVLTTLIFEMEKRDVSKGLATLCIGGGMGIAMCITRD